MDKETLFEQTFKKHAKIIKEMYGHGEKEFSSAEDAKNFCYENGLTSPQNATDADIDVDVDGSASVMVAGNDGANETLLVFPNKQEAQKFIQISA